MCYKDFSVLHKIHQISTSVKWIVWMKLSLILSMVTKYPWLSDKSSSILSLFLNYLFSFPLSICPGQIAFITYPLNFSLFYYFKVMWWFTVNSTHLCENIFLYKAFKHETGSYTFLVLLCSHKMNNGLRFILMTASLLT